MITSSHEKDLLLQWLTKIESKLFFHLLFGEPAHLIRCCKTVELLDITTWHLILTGIKVDLIKF